MASVGIKEIDIPGQQLQPNKIKFPTVLSPSSSSFSLTEITSWIKEHKKEVEAKLLKSGVLLFRGFPVTTPSDFLEFINAFEYEHGTYLGGGGPRNVVLGPIHTSTETPPDVAIQFHHELAYLPVNPRALFFFCEIPPAADGETPILASYRVYEKLKEQNPEFIDRLDKKKVRYTRVISTHDKCDRKYQRSWQEMYATEDRVEAEKRAHETGTDTVEWLEDGSMKVVTVPLDAIKFDERTKKHVFFNSIVLLHSASHGIKAAGSSLWAPTYGDFSPIADEDVLSALNIMKQEKVEFKWEKGDVVLVDNTLALHARNVFTPPRRILTAIIK
eukprot:Phypoly_transcript_11625.p1 GENE.Phypoly_transcript_11625~~Phypoly_transcript_11625.p1  ORF type:complete len:330 (+),score=63.91 Phypoly_transcript_11625:172-1161(+)